MKHNLLKSFAVCLVGTLAISMSASPVATSKWSNRPVVKREHKELLTKDTNRHLWRYNSAGVQSLPSVNRLAAPAVQAEESEWQTVVEEDFSLFTAGSEAEPDMTNILSSEGYILYDYVHTYGWTAVSVYQAGGCAYVVGDGISMLMTPVLDLSGDNGHFKITFSYRTPSESTSVYVMWGSGSSLIDGRKATATTTWKTGTIETDGGVENMAIQFYADADIFLDDIKVEQMGVVEPVEPVEPTLDAPSALAASDITSTGFVANWEVTSGATGYLLDVYYYENNEPQYLLKDEAVAATSYAVTGTQEGKVYYYTVRATDGTLVSEPSNEVLAKAASTSIGSVTALPATEVSDAGFRANWTAAENAAFYELTTLSLYTVPASGTFTHDNETFDRVTEGTESSPVYGAIQGALNDYTEYADWYAITPVMANGKIGLKNYYMIMGYYSMLYTPIYFVESNTASTVTISMDVKRVDCSAATEVGVCLVNAATEEAGEWQFQALTDAEMTLSFEFEPTESYYLAIGFDDPSNADYGSTGIVFFDRVTVEQANLSAGDQVIRVYAYDMPYNETYYVETSNKRDTEQFSYYVMAVTNGESEYLYSDPSNEIVVGTTGSVDAVTTASSRMYGADGELCVETDAAGVVEVYDAAGICVARQVVAEGATGIALPAGFYVVRLGGSVAKVLVK